MLDAPVSGGVAGAEEGTLTFMVGGSAEVLERARPVLEAMGKNIVHAGDSGSGQAAKLCNNMMLGISMIGTSEAFTMGQKLGLNPQTLFDIISTASGSCWALQNHLPIPGIVETAASNRGFRAGFAVAMMAKDLRLAQLAAKSVDASTPLGSTAAALYTSFEDSGNQDLDYSAIIKLIAAQT
jgi:3-hydroxyisobutyrate dehydrogenase